MASFVNVGRVAMRTTTGTTVISGLTGQPSLIALFCDDSTAFSSETGADQSFSLLSVGFASATTQEVTACVSDDFAALTMNNVKGMRTDCTLDCTFWGGTTDERVDISAIGATSFTLNFTVVQAGFAGSIHWIAIGGDFTAADVHTFELNTSTGAQSKTGLSFEPELVMFLSISPVTAAATLPITASAHARLMFGATDGTNEWVGVTGYQDNTANSDITNIFRSDACIHLLTAAAGATEAVADITSLNSDGYTLNVSDAAAGTGRWVAGIALGGGGAVKVGTETTRTTTGTKQTSGVGHQTRGLLFYSINRPVSGALSTTTAAGWSWGATDLTNQNYIIGMQDDNTAASEFQTAMDDDKCLLIPSQTNPISTMAEASVSASDSDSYTLNYSIANGTAMEFGWISFGDTPAAGGGAEQQELMLMGMGT